MANKSKFDSTSQSGLTVRERWDKILRSSWLEVMRVMDTNVEEAVFDRAREQVADPDHHRERFIVDPRISSPISRQTLRLGRWQVDQDLLPNNTSLGQADR